MLKNTQHQFLGQILGHSDDITPLIEEHGEISKQDRIHIYTSAYRIRLKQCIEIDHPVLGFFLGDTLFDLMVENYIDLFPSHNTSLRYFADHLNKLLSEQPPFKDHPIIAELARFERSMLLAFDSAESEISSMDELSLVPINNWPVLKFNIHPSVVIYSTTYNAVEIWQAIKQKKDVPVTSNSGTNFWMIWRSSERLTEFKSISAIEANIIDLMIKGNDFSYICEKLAEFYDENEIEQAIFSHLIKLLNSNILQLKY